MIKIALILWVCVLPLVGQSQSQPENVTGKVGSPATVEYVTNQDAWLRLYIEAEVKSIREAVDKVEKITLTRFENVNEWREQSKDRESKFVTRTEIWTAFGGIVAMMFMILNYIKKNNEKMKP